MNYLSHFYFDKSNNNNYEVVGGILPDLVKGCDRTWNLYPYKLPLSTYNSDIELALLDGWKKHILIDKIFHSSEYFQYHQHQLRIILSEIIKGSDVKPFFLAHIAFELLLDHLLIVNKKIEAQSLYHKITLADKQHIASFLVLNNIQDLPKFTKHYQKFLDEEFLITYANIDKIVFALTKVCNKIWEITFSRCQENEIISCLNEYKNILAEDFIIIFELINKKLDFK